MRRFDTGATRDDDTDKLDFEGFLSPLVLKRYAEYMHKHRIQADGELRDSDNWTKGIDKTAYAKSGWRHFFDWWSEHRGYGSREGMEDALCGILFNFMGYLHEHLKEQTVKPEPLKWHCTECSNWDTSAICTHCLRPEGCKPTHWHPKATTSDGSHQ